MLFARNSGRVAAVVIPPRLYSRLHSATEQSTGDEKMRSDFMRAYGDIIATSDGEKEIDDMHLKNTCCTAAAGKIGSATEKAHRIERTR